MNAYAPAIVGAVAFAAVLIALRWIVTRPPASAIPSRRADDAEGGDAQSAPIAGERK
jgi:hypothetical protein